jgi:hypothetical protein
VLALARQVQVPVLVWLRRKLGARILGSAHVQQAFRKKMPKESWQVCMGMFFLYRNEEQIEHFIWVGLCRLFRLLLAWKKPFVIMFWRLQIGGRRNCTGDNRDI